MSLEDKHVGKAPDLSPTNFIAKHFGVGGGISCAHSKHFKEDQNSVREKRVPQCEPKEKEKTGWGPGLVVGAGASNCGKGETHLPAPHSFNLFIYFSTRGGFSLHSLGWARAQ